LSLAFLVKIVWLVLQRLLRPFAYFSLKFLINKVKIDKNKMRL